MCDEGITGDVVKPIILPNAMEEAAQRYWRAASMWRGRIDTEWSYGDIISEVSDMQRYRGPTAFHAQDLLRDIINDHRPEVLPIIEQAVQEQL